MVTLRLSILTLRPVSINQDAYNRRKLSAHRDDALDAIPGQDGLSTNQQPCKRQNEGEKQRQNISRDKGHLATVFNKDSVRFLLLERVDHNLAGAGYRTF